MTDPGPEPPTPPAPPGREPGDRTTGRSAPGDEETGHWRPDPGRPSWDSGEPTAGLSVAELLARFPLREGGRYEALDVLGEGGMGIVYKAHDRQLQRTVAIKLLKRLEPEDTQRFLQEARAQAQVDHPNVCRIFEAAEAQGHPYLVMPFVDGPTLRQACDELDQRGKVEVLLQVAEALHACHRAGIVHRDVKPGNVMLQRTEEGGWHAYLMDFGVARDLADASRTHTHAIMGTPMYLSPEQAQGQTGKVDRRSDVYALGTLLYECLTGAPPFVDESPLALLRRIAEDDPVPPAKRAPDIPSDLQTIVLKALEKDPARRYDSARAFGEDLRRFLDGEPIQARRPSLAYRLGKRLQKNRLVAALLAVLILAAGYGVFSSLRARAQVRFAQQLAQEVERLDSRIFQVRSLPRHDARGEIREVRRELDRLQAETEAQGRWAQAPARLALGRGYLALGDLEKARLQLEAARRAAPADPDVAQALGATLARLYVQELEGLRGQALEDRRKELDATLRTPALALLKEAQGGGGEGSAYAQGLLALVQRDLAGALARAQEAQAQQPWFPEPWLLEAEVRKERALQLLGASRREEALAEMDREGACLAAAQDRARSAPEPLVEEAQRRFALLGLKLDQGQATPADRDWALEAVQQALQVDPEDWRALSFGTAIHRRWATDQLVHGTDPSAELDAAARDAEKALALRPGEATLWVNWATVLRNRAELTFEKGGDPEPFLSLAEAGLKKALQQPRLHDYLYDGLGNIHALRAERQLMTGQDPTGEVNAAAQALEAASTLRPWAGHDLSEGAAYQILARYKAWTAQDPRPALDLAIRCHRRGLTLQPSSAQSQVGLAEALLDRAEAAQDLGQPDPASADEARLLMQTLCARQPRNAEALATLARARFVSALAAHAAPAAREALSLQRQAIALAPQNADLRLAWGRMAMAANRALGLPQDPAALQALATLAKARPWDGWARLLAAEAAARSGRAAEAQAEAREALRLNPTLRREAVRRSLV